MYHFKDPMKKPYAVILAIVLIGLAGVVLVNEMNSTISRQADPKIVDLPTGSEKETKVKSGSSALVKEGPTVSEYTAGPLSFQFQSNWTATNQGGYIYFSENNNNYREYAPLVSLGEDVYLISPDARMVSDSAYFKMESGRILIVSVQDGEYTVQNIDDQIAETQNGLGKYNGTYEVIKIDGHDAVLASGGGHGVGTLSTRVSVNGKGYQFALLCPDSAKTSEWDFMKEFLKTVKIR